MSNPGPAHPNIVMYFLTWCIVLTFVLISLKFRPPFFTSAQSGLEKGEKSGLCLKSHFYYRVELLPGNGLSKFLLAQ